MKERIRAIMESKGMTQQEFSQFLEMSPASLSSIFTGRTNPTLNVVESIRKKFDNINLEWLMFGNGNMFLNDHDNPDSETDNVGQSIASGCDNFENENYSTNNSKYRNDCTSDGSMFYGNRENMRNANLSANVSSFPDMKIINKNTRKIKEIRVFYDDQTYESFIPKE